MCCKKGCSENKLDKQPEVTNWILILERVNESSRNVWLNFRAEDETLALIIQSRKTLQGISYHHNQVHIPDQTKSK